MATGVGSRPTLPDPVGCAVRTLRLERSGDGLTAIVSNGSVEETDLECSTFDDWHAGILSESTTLTSLEVGATRMTRSGLRKICRMRQLKRLDIWATRIEETDLDMLASLENLEYLSIGSHDDQTDFTPAGTFPRLERLPSLKKLWLDGFRVSKGEWEYLNDRYEEVRVTSVGK